METKSEIAFICQNGNLIRPIKRGQKWKYQVFYVVGGLKPIQGKPRTEAENRKVIEFLGANMGGGKWV